LDCDGGGGESTNHPTKSNLEVYFHHFGHRVVVPQRELAAYGSQYVTFKTFTKSFNGRKVLYSYRDITVLLEFYLRQLLGSFNKKINKMELTLGGDHGKGAFTFIACLIV
jgi:hypothetical protein